MSQSPRREGASRIDLRNANSVRNTLYNHKQGNEANTIRTGEKVKEQKEKAERESRNVEHADSSYRLPSSDELVASEDKDLSGLPWGSISMKHVLAMGHETESRRSSANESGHGGDHNGYGDAPQHYATSSPFQPYQTTSYGSSTNSSGGDDYSYQDLSPYYYDFDPNNGHGSHHQTRT